MRFELLPKAPREVVLLLPRLLVPVELPRLKTLPLLVPGRLLVVLLKLLPPFMVRLLLPAEKELVLPGLRRLAEETMGLPLTVKFPVLTRLRYIVLDILGA